MKNSTGGNYKIKDILREKKNLIDHSLSVLLHSDSPAHDTLFKAMNYSLLAGGKRIRPALYCMVLDSFGLDSSDYMEPACAIECLHTYSLIHDDLPAMDNDDYRRGKLTNHRVFGAGMATQAGDGLQAFAFHLLASDQKLSASLRCELLVLLSYAIGPCGMVGGQAQDIEMEGRHVSLADLRELDRCKTGALICASVDMAAATADAEPSVRHALHTYGQHLGLLFQITDDLLDVNGHLDEMGKNPHQDEIDHKATYVTILGAEEARRLAEKEAALARESISSLEEPFEPLQELVNYILNRTA